MKSVLCLDRVRLGNQRREAKQLICGIVKGDPSQLEFVQRPHLVPMDCDKGWEEYLSGLNNGWVTHPARKMWEGHVGALAVYYDACLLAWQARGYTNNMPPLSVPGQHLMPDWFGDEAFHASHRSNLLRKQPEWYAQFGWTEPHDLEYVWPR